MDAFERLKEEAAKATLNRPPKALQLPQPKMPDPVVAKAALEVTAREGLPVTGVNAESWEALRPKIVPETKANKVRVCVCAHACMCVCARVRARTGWWQVSYSLRRLTGCGDLLCHCSTLFRPKKMPKAKASEVPASHPFPYFFEGRCLLRRVCLGHIAQLHGIARQLTRLSVVPHCVYGAQITRWRMADRQVDCPCTPAQLHTALPQAISSFAGWPA